MPGKGAGRFLAAHPGLGGGQIRLQHLAQLHSLAKAQQSILLAQPSLGAHPHFWRGSLRVKGS